nr:Rnase Y domain-containing protein [Secundilactobacillus silagei]
MINTIIVVATLVIGLLAGYIIRRQKHRRDVDAATRQAAALRESARKDAEKQATKYLTEAKAKVQQDRQATEPNWQISKQRLITVKNGRNSVR